jgi:hypothetical protein
MRDCHVGSCGRNRRLGSGRESDRSLSVRRGLRIRRSWSRLHYSERLGTQFGERGRAAISRVGGLSRTALDREGQSRCDLFAGWHDHSIRQRNDLAASVGRSTSAAASPPPIKRAGMRCSRPEPSRRVGRYGTPGVVCGDLGLAQARATACVRAGVRASNLGYTETGNALACKKVNYDW